ncbi:MAG: lysophospholipid acyltransferase family protein, partial [Candidatus Thermoplasmatota archaeon]|nr:lysophospholipid acyltransferase family protein [Candidatus Thermoplasmatota archaeon]
MSYGISKFVAGPLLKVLFQLEVNGLENIPAEGKAILASNHFSFLDHFLLPVMVDRDITFIAKSELFENPIWGFLLTRWGQISLNRGTGDNSAVNQAIEVLENGELFGIYPEGTRTRDGKLHGGHTGVARISLISGAPVIPVGMIGTYEILPRGAVKPNLGKAEIRIGKPMDFSQYEGKENDRKITKMITDEIMGEIGKLIGQTVEGEIYRYDEILN